VKSDDYIKLWIIIFRIHFENTFGDVMFPFTFQHNNAPVNIARNIHTWLDEHDVQMIQWPAQSPNLSVIEKVWVIFQNRVMRVHPSNKLELIQCLFRA